jgi:hypothetical protein
MDEFELKGVEKLSPVSCAVHHSMGSAQGRWCIVMAAGSSAHGGCGANSVEVVAIRVRCVLAATVAVNKAMAVFAIAPPS